MSAPPVSAEEHLLVRIRRQRIVIIVLAIMTLSLLSYLTLSANSESDFTGLSDKRSNLLVPPSTAEPNIEAYRSGGAYAKLSYHKKAKVFGILHDTARFRKYIDVTFNEFATHHPTKPGYTWMVGIYPMVCKADFGSEKKPRIGIYLIPTMLKTGAVTGPRIIDYMDALKSADSVYYPGHTATSRTPAPGDEIIFDEGQLWP